VSARPAVFLDRDGTINVEVEGALKEPEQLVLLPGAAEAIARLDAAGLATVVVTNQSAIGRGWMTERDYERVTRSLEERLAHAGAHVDRILHCPHHPTEGVGKYRRECPCRKPGTGLYEAAIAELDLDPRASFVVGDARRDLAAGRALGMTTILVATGKGAHEHARLVAAGEPPDAFVPDLAAAVELVLAEGT